MLRDIEPGILARIADAAEAAPVWHRSDFDEIADLIGAAKARRLLRDFADHLASASAELRQVPTVLRLREIAHDLKSSSGQLGFAALAAQSRRILEDRARQIGKSELDRWLDVILASAEIAGFALADGPASEPPLPACRAA